MYQKRQTKRVPITLSVNLYQILEASASRLGLTVSSIVTLILWQRFANPAPLVPPLTEPEDAPKRMRRANILMHAFVFVRAAAYAHNHGISLAEVVNQALLAYSPLFPAEFMPPIPPRDLAFQQALLRKEISRHRLP